MNEVPANQSFRDGVQFAWDSTSIKIAEDCLYKYKLKMIDGWQPASKSVHLLFGGWYASALERYYKLKATGLDTNDALCEVVRQALVETWFYNPECEKCKGEGYDLDHPDGVPFSQSQAAVFPCDCGKPWASDHTAKTRENLIRSIIWYVDQFEDDPVEIFIKPDGSPAVEYSFSFEVDDGIMFSGHIDRLVQYGGGYYVMDQKTSGSTITPQFFDQFDPDSQMSLYTMAGKIIYRQPVKGVIIDAAQIAVGFTRFMRGFTFRDEPKINEWYKSAMYHIQAARKATEADYFPMNPSSCNKYAGCEFRRICNQSPHVRDNFLKGDFVKAERWDPLKRR